MSFKKRGEQRCFTMLRNPRRYLPRTGTVKAAPPSSSPLFSRLPSHVLDPNSTTTCGSSGANANEGHWQAPQSATNLVLEVSRAAGAVCLAWSCSTSTCFIHQSTPSCWRDPDTSGSEAVTWRFRKRLRGKWEAGVASDALPC